MGVGYTNLCNLSVYLLQPRLSEAEKKICFINKMINTKTERRHAISHEKRCILNDTLSYPNLLIPIHVCQTFSPRYFARHY